MKQLKNNTKGMSHKRNFSVLLLVSCVSSIMGCESMATQDQVYAAKNSTLQVNPLPDVSSEAHYQQLLNRSQQYQQIASEVDGLDADLQAQSKALKALQQHLRTDHVAITEVRSFDRPFIKDSSVDVGSKNALESLLLYSDDRREERNAIYDSYDDEVEAKYDSNGDHFYGEAYRTKEGYLTSNNTEEVGSDRAYSELDELYLNYADENKGVVPFVGYDITRQEGMSETYRLTTDKVIHYTENYFNCVADFSSDLDDLVSENPLITYNSDSVKSLKKTYAQCLTQNESDYADTLKNAKGYQLQYLQREQGCASRYDKQINDILDPSRKPKSIDYDHYDSIYESYEACDWSVVLQRETEPAIYIEEEWSDYIIQYRQDIVQCTDNMIAEQKSAALKGKTFKNNPLTYANIYDNYVQCEDEALAKKTEREDIVISVEELVAEAEVEKVKEKEPSRFRKEVEKFFNYYKRTPAQIEANNFYQNQNLLLSVVSEFNSNQKQVNTIYSYDYMSPTSHYSLQLPVSLDFKKDKLTVDASAFLPFLALIDPEHTPLPEDMESSLVAFNLPDEIAKNIPTEVIYDAFIDALSHSLSELDASYFTNYDITNDSFAASLGARSAVKINLDSKQTGKLIGVTIKHMSNTLEAYLEEHPPKDLEKMEIFSIALDKWKEISGNFQSNDVGTIAQLIEAVLPITFNKTNYLYLDARGHLLGNQTRTTIGGDMFGMTSTILNQTTFDKKKFIQHSLNPLFQQTFGKPFTDDMPAAADGNIWLKTVLNRDKKLAKAQRARYEYDYDDEEFTIDDEAYEEVEAKEYTDNIDSVNTDSEDSESKDTEDDYESAIRIIEQGNVEVLEEE